MNGEPIKRIVLFIAAMSLAAVSAHAETPASSCHGTRQPRQVAELLFGRGTGNGRDVSEAAWEHFVAEELTPQFPEGLTVTEAIGQWRDPTNGKIGRERSERVEIVLPGKPDDETRLDTIVKAYERDFHQRSVVVIVRPACVSF
ncbi:MAG TPA: DUF3574 domain-containing protein [Xanthobacteraceae bacterium]|jgi:hypothetical protein|nr:DUF3574 domain-containing protein [Xanthobacteraceae bacterium]